MTTPYHPAGDHFPGIAGGLAGEIIGVSVDTFMHEDMHTVLSSYLPQAGETAGN